MNRHLHRVWSLILGCQDEWDADDVNQTNFPVAVTDLVAGQQDYTLSSSLKILKIKRVEVNYGSGWVRATPIDVSEIPGPTDAASIANAFTANAPRYDVEKNSVKLYPVPASHVDDGLKVFYQREPIEFNTASTNEPGFDEPFHRMLSIGASLDYAVAKGLPKAQALADMLRDYDLRLAAHFGRKALDRPLSMQTVNDDYN